MGADQEFFIIKLPVTVQMGCQKRYKLIRIACCIKGLFQCPSRDLARIFTRFPYGQLQKSDTAITFAQRLYLSQNTPVEL